MEGRLLMMGDAQTFWEANRVRLPLFIPSQEERCSSVKGDSEYEPKTAALEKFLLFSCL